MTPEYARYDEFGTGNLRAGEVRASGSMTFEVKPEVWDRLARFAFGGGEGRTLPRWLCWLLGHTPTQEDSFLRLTRRCCCGAERDVPAEVVEAVSPRWWRWLAGERQWRQRWTGTVKSSYRTPADQARLEKEAEAWQRPTP